MEEDPDAQPGHHFKLKAVPFSKNITFGVEGNPFFLYFIVCNWNNDLLSNCKWSTKKISRFCYISRFSFLVLLPAIFYFVGRHLLCFSKHFMLLLAD